MMYWHKVQMSCRQTQPVVLRRGVRFRHGSLFCHQASGRVNSSSACALCGIGIVSYRHLSCWHLPFTAVSFVFGQFGESLTNTNLTSRAFAITWTWRHLYKRGWVTWKEISPDRRCSIWFPNKVYRSSWNKFCWMQNNLYFPALKSANLKETPCMAFEVISELA